MNPDARIRAVSSILVIDDEPQIRRVLSNALEGMAERVIEAPTGAAGLDLAAADAPALIVLDLTLPDRDGLDVCRDLRTNETRMTFALLIKL